MKHIDGSFGEGGGQILRSALGLSLVTRTPFTITGIRAGRKKPGLLRQHLTSLRAAQAVSNARVTGAELGSQMVQFVPGKVVPGEYSFQVGSAGSAGLVLQTVLPALMSASGSSQLTLEGGTHNIWSPPFDFLNRSFAPLLERMGPKVTLELERYGFYPAGGGKFKAHIAPAPLTPLHLLKRGDVQRIHVRALTAHVSERIGARECSVISNSLSRHHVTVEVVRVENSHGPGNVVMVEIESDEVTELFTGFGRKGVRAERVALACAQEAAHYLDASVVVGEHLADQLLIPMAMAGEGSFVTSKLSLHATTNMKIIEEFLPVRFIATKEGEHTTVVCKGGEL